MAPPSAPPATTSPPLSAREATLLVQRHIARQPTLRIPLADARGTVLAEAVASPLDIPPHTNSAMDGYAARGVDVAGASAEHPARLTVVEHIAAGGFPVKMIAPGECARIFTGAPLPEGADTVIRQEDTDYGREVVTITRDRDVGVNWRKAGEDLKKGEIALDERTELGAAELGVLASMAVAHPLVYRRPRVGILASGDEIVDLDQSEAILSGRKIATSNTYTLNALVEESGGQPVNLGIAGDTVPSMREHLERSRDCDLLVTTGGISVGDHDVLRLVLEQMGTEFKFWKLRMRPGAPVGFGLLDGMPWIGLPGNPVSTMVTFELFVRPAIRKMSGRALPFRRAVPVRLHDPVVVKPRLQHFLRAIVNDSSGQREVRLTGPQGSGILTSMVKANALLILPEGQLETPAGSHEMAIMLDDPHHQTEPPF
ncbi:MAG: gephyrin-like molybdotransferase Glp [Gemmatimonadota bacterium]